MLMDSIEESNTMLDGTAASHNRLLYCQNICEQLKVNPLEHAMELYHSYWDNFFKYLL